LRPLGIELHGNPKAILPHVINFSIPGIDAEARMVALKDLISISNGSACTSQSYKPSHVLSAMGLSDDAVAGAVRISWCHMTSDVDWNAIAQRIESMR
jgi:cysteine desulfurase